MQQLVFEEFGLLTRDHSAGGIVWLMMGLFGTDWMWGVLAIYPGREENGIASTRRGGFTQPENYT